MSKYYWFKLVLVFISLLSTACEQNQNTAVSKPATKRTFQSTSPLQGIVSSGKTPYKTGTIEAVNENGKKIATAEVNEGHFTLTIPQGTELPVELRFSSESLKEQLYTVVITDTVKKYYITPTTTSIAKAAKAMGGYTHANMVRAAKDTTHMPDANKTTTGWRGDPTTQYGGWH